MSNDDPAVCERCGDRQGVRGRVPSVGGAGTGRTFQANHPMNPTCSADRLTPSAVTSRIPTHTRKGHAPMTNCQQMPPPPPDPAQQPPELGPVSKVLGWAKRHKVWATVIVVVVIFVIIGALAPSDTSDDTSSDSTSDVSPTESTEPPTESTTEPTGTGKPKAKPTPDMTVSQENAIAAAQDYLDFGSFSRTGLIGQLSSKYGEGFPKADAVYAVNHIDVNWNEQAADAAQDYLDTGSFSRTGLIQQLSSKYGDGFTHAQAVYGVNQVGL